jgi:hypothetical protein
MTGSIIMMETGGGGGQTTSRTTTWLISGGHSISSRIRGVVSAAVGISIVSQLEWLSVALGKTVRTKRRERQWTCGILQDHTAHD